MRFAGRRTPAKERAVDGERAFAREHFVQDETERVDIGPRGDFAPRQLFRRHVAWRPRDLGCAAATFSEIREAKVHEVRPAPPVDQHVRGFQVAVQDLALVCGRETGAELAGELERLVRWQPADAPQQRREILAVDVFHREEVLAAGFRDVVHAADVRMRDLPRQPDFLMEARQPVGAMRELLRQELQRDRLSELQVVRTIHLAHATAAQQSDDAVAAGQHRAGNELRAVEGVRRQQPIGSVDGQRGRARCVRAHAAGRAVAARLRNVVSTCRTLHRPGTILVIE